nr:MAG: hypothetical protein DIU78_19645 [Pseudomonadota bacterium]
MALSRRMRIGGVAALLIVVAGVSGWLVAREREPRGAIATAPLASGTDWPVAQRRVYAVSLGSRVTMGDHTVLDVTLEGRLTAIRVQPTEPAPGLVLALGFDAERVVLTSSPEDQAALERAVEEPFGATFAPTGLVQTVAFPELPKPEPEKAVSRGLLRTIVAALQVKRPPAPDTHAWDVDERDAVGLVRTRYQRKGTFVSKTKSTYLRITNNDPLTDARTELVEALAELSFRRGAVPSPEALMGVSAREKTRVHADGPLPPLSSETKLEIRLVEQSDANENAKALAQAVRGYLVSGLDDRTVENEMLVDQAKLEGPGFLELLREIVSLGSSDPARRARLFAMLSARLRFDEKNVREAERLIRAGAASKATLIDALGAASTAASQSVLHAILREPDFGEEDRRRALIALSFVERPSEATLSVLKELTDTPKYRTQALYGLGAAAYRLGASDPEGARAVTAGLVRSLDEASDPNEQVKLLKAVGNAGSADAFTAIEAKLHSPNPAVRATAIWALRRVPGDRAEQAIARALIHDPAAMVRQRAVDTLGYRTVSPVLVYAVRDALSKEADVPVRRELVRAAMRWATAAPVLREPLMKLAQSDPDPKIRELLREWHG